MPPENSLRQTSRALWVFFLIFITISGVFIVRYLWDENDSQQQTKSPSATIDLSDVRFIDAQTFKAREQAGETLQFLDLRTLEQYQKNHILDSLPLKPHEMLTEFPVITGTPIFIIDESVTSEVLHSLKEAFDRHGKSFAILADGINGWQMAGGLTLSAGDPYSFVDQSKVTFITPEKTKDFLTDQVFILDVQTALAYQETHLPGAVNIPLPELEHRRSELPFTQSIVVYGTNDLEGFQAGVRLFDMNFLGARTLEGGLTAWKNARFPTEAK